MKPGECASSARLVRADTRRWLLLCALLLVAAAGCKNEDEDLLGQATAQASAGKLDDALATLQVLRTRSPDSDEARAAGPLAAGWLVKAARESNSTAEQRARLKQALQWHPADADAQLEVCRLELRGGDLEQAARCVNQLGTSGANAARLQQLRLELHRAELKHSESERKQLLEGGRPHQLQALVERYGGSPEAEQARERLRAMKSLCLDRERFVRAVRAELLRQAEDVTSTLEAVATEAALEVSERLADLGERLRTKANLLRALLGDLDAHTVEPGEEPAREALRKALYAVSDAGLDLGESLEKKAVENIESYASGSLRVAKLWLDKKPKLEQAVEEQLRSVDRACAGRPDAGPSGSRPDTASTSTRPPAPPGASGAGPI